LHYFEALLERDSKILDEIEQRIQKQEAWCKAKNQPGYIQLAIKSRATGRRVRMGHGYTAEVLETRRDNTTLIFMAIEDCKGWVAKEREQIAMQAKTFEEVQEEITRP
jgi:hypothetical protein